MTTPEPGAPGQPGPTAPQPDDAVLDRYRSNEPSDPAEIRRKLLFGVALVLALLSVYAGLFGWGRVVQYGLSGLAVVTVFVAILSGATGPPMPQPPPAAAPPPAEPPSPPGAGA